MINTFYAYTSRDKLYLSIKDMKLDHTKADMPESDLPGMEDLDRIAMFNPAYPWIFLSPNEFERFMEAFREAWAPQKFKCDSYWGECRLGKRCSNLL